MKLKEALKLVPKLKGLFPAANHIKMADGVITWTNMSVTMSITVDDIPKTVNGLVEPKILAHTVNSLEKFTVSEEDAFLVVRSENGEYKMPMLPPDDFPIFEEFESLSSLELNGKALSCLYEAASFTLPDDDLALSNINLSFTKGLRITATNRFVLYMANIPIDTDEPFEASIPRDIVNYIPKNVVGCMAYFGSRFAVFDFGDVIMRFRLWDGKFPDASFLLDYESTFSVSLKPRVFLEQIAPLRAYTSPGVNGIEFKFHDGVTISAENVDESVNGKIVLKHLCSLPEEYTVKVNYFYLHNALSVFDSVINLDYVEKSNPLRFYNDDKFVVLMPIM